MTNKLFDCTGSDASSFITGETINVDGGYMIRA
jgi:enoyl-[acyl-carrier-protein] reductase (NADH)